MIIPEIFKYNSLISIPLFSVISLLLISKLPDFSFSKHTVSKSILFIKHPVEELIFRLNFLLKSLLDLGFAFYVINYFKISLNSTMAWSFILSAVFFGILSYFVEGKFAVLHKIIIYSSGVLWGFVQIMLAYHVGDYLFIQLTYFATIIPIALAFAFLFAKKLNVFIQIVCMSFWYFWLILFVFKFL